MFEFTDLLFPVTRVENDGEEQYMVQTQYDEIIADFYGENAFDNAMRFSSMATAFELQRQKNEKRETAEKIVDLMKH